MARTAVGIDVGGTKVAGILMDEEGRVLASREEETPAEDVEATMATIARVAMALRNEGSPVAVGIGAAGMVDHAAGVLRWAPNLAWTEVAIGEQLSTETGLPAVVDNDANTAAWGEFRFGAARGVQHALVVTVGTGIGGGIVAGGRLQRGAHGFAGEVGHVIVEPGGPVCGCGNRGCWEQVASGRALDRLARRAAEDQPGGLIGRLAAGRPPTGRVVAEAAVRGDRAAIEILREVGRRLGEGLAGLANVLDPEIVVVGGGVAEIGPAMLDPAREAFLRTVEAPAHRPDVPLVPAELGNQAGAVGAAALALEAVS
ncbi:MAG TPA: ROK family protein [Actinomycetota bacterium]|jgi:glucokinase